ncbi:MAG TPA: Bax inhibitor-1 family protein [Candidatus Dormibacteraeota bacterium]|nr:Bax inhibitor-1 family protein [Candidatus Dormibacteraeota bacterium]
MQQPVARAATQSLLAQVLGITAVGLCVTALSVILFPTVPFGIGLFALIGGLILLFVMSAVQSNPGLALLLFYVFAFLEGVGISPTIEHYLNLAGGPSIVFNAALTTGLGMFALAAIVYATGLDLRRFQGIFMIALLGLVLVGIVGIFLHFVSPTVYSWITLVIFTGFVLIDFARIRAGGDGVSPVMMAVSIYLDIINIFLALLQIFGGRRSND